MLQNSSNSYIIYSISVLYVLVLGFKIGYEVCEIYKEGHSILTLILRKAIVRN